MTYICIFVTILEILLVASDQLSLLQENVSDMLFIFTFYSIIIAQVKIPRPKNIRYILSRASAEKFPGGGQRKKDRK